MEVFSIFAEKKYLKQTCGLKNILTFFYLRNFKCLSSFLPTSFFFFAFLIYASSAVSKCAVCNCFRKVTIMEDEDQNIHLKNLSIQQSANEEEALNLLFLGDTNRMIAEVSGSGHLGRAREGSSCGPQMEKASRLQCKEWLLAPL